MGPQNWEDYRLPHIQETINEVQRIRTFILGREAAFTAATLDPRLDPDQGEQHSRPDNIPEDVLGAARDMADYLGGNRIPPETNRNGIPHSREWDLGNAMNVVGDLALSLDKAEGEMPEPTRLKALRELLELAIKIALVSSYPENKPLLDQLVAGRNGGSVPR